MASSPDCGAKHAVKGFTESVITEPQVAARAVLVAIRKRRRQMYVGVPTVYTIWGNRLAPWLADRYLARTAVKGQQTDEAAPRTAHDNLFEPVPGDPGARGPFSDQAHERSLQLWATEHRAPLLASGGGLAAAGALLAGRIVSSKVRS